MTGWTLILRNLWFFRQIHTPTAIGAMVAATVIIGAMVVGDSMRYSLRRMALGRLGQIETAIQGSRFFKEDLGERLDGYRPNAEATSPFPHPTPVLTMKGGAVVLQGEHISRAGGVDVYGLLAAGWNGINQDSTAPPTGRSVIINHTLAVALNNPKVGDTVTLWIETPAAIPGDSLLGQKDDLVRELTLTVAAIVPSDTGAGALSLSPAQQTPRVAFLDLRTMQASLDLDAVAPSRSAPQGRPSRVNSVWSLRTQEPPLPLTPQEVHQSSLSQGTSLSILSEGLGAVHQLDDYSLRIQKVSSQGLQLESDQILLSDRFAQAAEVAAREGPATVSPTYVYLANRLVNANDPQKFSTYSSVAGLDGLLTAGPLGEFEYVGPKPESLEDDDVVVNAWLAADLGVAIGDFVDMSWYAVGSRGDLPEQHGKFRVAGIVAMTGPAIDRTLAPTVKGITDVESLSDWDQPFPMDLKAITDRDEAYWDEHRAAPKAFLKLAVARKLWPSRYGSLTSVRVDLPSSTVVADSASEFAKPWEQRILRDINPSIAGLQVTNVREQALAASTGSTDFTGLFLGFSMFLIAAASVLIMLLFGLMVDQRVAQLGLLRAQGFTDRQLRGHLLAEATPVLLIGIGVGALLAQAYAQGILYLLQTWWRGAVGASQLYLDVQPLTVFSGAAVALALGLAAVWFALRRVGQLSVRQQLTGVASPVMAPSSTLRRIVPLGVFLAIAVGVASWALSGQLPPGDAAPGLPWNALVFFMLGLTLLASGVFAFDLWLDSGGLAKAWQPTGGSVVALAARNAGRSRRRSLLSMALVSAATFVVVAVAAGRADPTRLVPEKSSGNGGFTIVADATSPLLYDLNSAAGRSSLNASDPPLASKPQEASPAVPRVFGFRLQPGDDASCLNLYQTKTPPVWGAPREFLERGGFAFAGGKGENPWQALLETPADGTIPAIGDMATLMFSLKKQPGDRLDFPRTAQGPTSLRVAGMLTGSLFQGGLIISEEHFLKLFPERKGAQLLLVECPLESAEETMAWLETELAPYGVDAERVSTRIARFLEVQNTYLSTFLVLGGLGLLVGTLGLAAVMRRNVLERRSELALLRATGFSKALVARLVASENFLLLLWGLLVGTTAGLCAMTPHLRSTGADVPWLGLGGMLALVAVTGLLGSRAAVRAAVTSPIVATLRGEH